MNLLQGTRRKKGFLQACQRWMTVNQLMMVGNIKVRKKRKNKNYLQKQRNYKAGQIYMLTMKKWQKLMMNN